jgi:protein gp37
MTGCTEVSAGCDHCYAATMARTRLRHLYRAQPALRNGGRQDDPFAPRFWPDRLAQPRRWKRPRRVFVNSMSDLFHAHFTIDLFWSP